MSGLPWFRMYTDFLDDPKMVKLAFEDQRHFIGILALKASEVIDSDVEEALLDRIVAQKLWIDHAIIRDVKARLIDAGLIDQSWNPIAWAKRQKTSDFNHSGAERQARYRQKQKQKQVDAERDASRDAGVTLPDKDIEKDKERDKRETDTSAGAETSSVARRKKPTPSGDQEREIVCLYHDTLSAWPRVSSAGWERSLTRKNLLARWAAEPDCRDMEFWPAFFAAARTQKFWNTGEAGKPIEQARLSWLLTPSKFDAVIERGLELAA